MFGFVLVLAFTAVQVAVTQVSPTRSSGTRAIVVLPFDNHTGDASLDVLERGLADMVMTDLTGVDGVTVVERARLDQVIAELALQRSALVDPATAQRIGRVVGAELAVVGSIAAIAPEVRLDVRLVEVATAKVLLADKITGPRDDLFALEDALMRRFAAALGARAVGGRGSGAGDVDALVEYARGLALADAGQTEEASKRLQALVAKAPGFTLAQTRYTEIMRRMYAAKATRTSALGDEDARLLADATAAIARGSAERSTGVELQRHLAWRIVLAKRPLAALARIAVDDDASETTFRPADAELAKGLMLTHYEEARRLVDELRAVRARGLEDAWDPPFSPLDDATQKRGEELGLGDRPDEWTFASVPNVALDLARFVLLGRPSIFLHVDLDVRPSLAELDPSYVARGLALIDEALADLKAHPPMYAQRDTIAALDLKGEALHHLGRTSEAIATWQGILDAYPKAEEFPDIEERIKDALGVDDE